MTRRHVPSRSLTIEQILTILAETPPRNAALTAGLVPAQLHATPNPGEWSANDVLAHLHACGDVWGSNFLGMLAEDTPTLRGVIHRAWIKKTDYRELDFRPSLRAFATQRANLLCLIGGDFPPVTLSEAVFAKRMISREAMREMLRSQEQLPQHDKQQ